ncbi:MAG: restriction endonuclease, partial [Nitrospirae bacterium]|nr:restriction endonuclease [Nitrospirota bacterium]
MTDVTPQEKGDRLEAAVKAIESAIINSDHCAREGSYAIESKKLIVVNGVRHEIDLFVTATLARGYVSVFIFECKNWQSSVSKNDLIVFSEKIKASGAQRGFFVARSYSRDAQAQAKTDPRISLLSFNENDPSKVPNPMDFAMVEEKSTSTKLEVHR